MKASEHARFCPSAAAGRSRLRARRSRLEQDLAARARAGSRARRARSRGGGRRRAAPRARPRRRVVAGLLEAPRRASARPARSRVSGWLRGLLVSLEFVRHCFVVVRFRLSTLLRSNVRDWFTPCRRISRLNRIQTSGFCGNHRSRCELLRLGERRLAEQHLHLGVEVGRRLHPELRARARSVCGPCEVTQSTKHRALAGEVADQRRELADRSRRARRSRRSCSRTSRFSATDSNARDLERDQLRLALLVVDAALDDQDPVGDAELARAARRSR